jgi:toxin-antitoxin system PIN domain toxin
VAARCLPDVNVWVALLDEAHVFHTQALAFIQRKRLKLATCAMVENGVIRVLNLPGYSRLGPAGFEPVAAKLAEICASLDHEFWPCDVSLRDPARVNWPRVIGHQHVTDVYLLALAVAHDGCLVTLDHGVAVTTVPGASARHLEHL